MASPKTLTTHECFLLLNWLIHLDTVVQPHPKSVRNYTIAVLMLDAGLRVGEVVQLHISDLWFNSIPVTSIIIRPEIAKNHTERIIPVSQRLSNALKKHHTSLTTPNIYPMESYAFRSGYRGKPLTTRQVERIIRSAAEKSLGRPIHPHVLRHTFASRLMRTTNARVVQELLGHKNLSSTQIYTHPNSEDLKKAIENIDESRNNLERHGVTYKDLDRTPDRLDTPSTDRNMG